MDQPPPECADCGHRIELHRDRALWPACAWQGDWRLGQMQPWCWCMGWERKRD